MSGVRNDATDVEFPPLIGTQIYLLSTMCRDPHSRVRFRHLRGQPSPQGRSNDAEQLADGAQDAGLIRGASTISGGRD